jgi:hypothetical protein
MIRITFFRVILITIYFLVTFDVIYNGYLERWYKNIVTGHNP